MSSPLAIHGGTPLIDQPAPHLHWPPITEATTAAVMEQLHRAVSIPDRSGVIAELEDRLADYFGVRHAVLTSSGTAALHSAYAGVRLGAGDEVIVPAYTFHATASPLLHLGVVPVLVDCDAEGNLDPDQVEAAITSATKAIAVTHMWGLPAQIELLETIAGNHGLHLIEDGSHAHGASVNGRKVGTFGQVSAFSMNGPKSLSAGEGGFVLTDDDEIYYRVLLHGQYNKRCRTEIPVGHPLRRFAITGTGLKLRIHPLAAAIAIDQLHSLDTWLEHRRSSAKQMIHRLRDLPGVVVPEIPASIEPSWYALPLVFRPEEADGLSIAALVSALHAEGCLEVDQPGSTRPLHEHALFSTDASSLLPVPSRRQPWGDFPRAVSLYRSTVKMPVPHDDGTALNLYPDAFGKVIHHRHHLTEACTQ
ncbi:DegT/DnrJ/EryC1/StrS family aminotransferase [Saccharopolyspora sp. SCSIO 74807]|uniref:DegT/DnrJ/EryC1/StrS family aminotransferase n=1 Tax=Saccharopolyspora sp. SCSIO 74807 TaxID=3118084 RepID=UPI0030CA5FEB